MGSLEFDRFSCYFIRKKIPIVIFCMIAMTSPTLEELSRVEYASDNTAVTIAFETEASKIGQALRCPSKVVQDCFVLCSPDGRVL